jgi:hypothetical protein
MGFMMGPLTDEGVGDAEPRLATERVATALDLMRDGALKEIVAKRFHHEFDRPGFHLASPQGGRASSATRAWTLAIGI